MTSLGNFLRVYPFGALLIAIFVMIVGSPLTAQIARDLQVLRGPLGLAPLTILLTITSAFAVWNLARSRARLIAAAGAILILLGLSNVELSRLGLDAILAPHTFDVVHVVAQTFFLLYVTATILRTVFLARVVDGNILCGAACVYLLVGIVWGYGYTVLEIVDRGSFSVVEPVRPETVNLYEEPGWLVYFSFTTLTTVGFGDILPTRPFARSLAVLEAVIGQIMLVVMMARLVGLHVAHTTSAKSARVKFSTEED